MGQKINFEIGSTFSGEGFKAAQATVKGVTSDIRSGVAAASQLSSAFDGLDASTAKSMRAMTSLMQSLVTLNATAILTQAAMLAISAYVNKCNEEMERLQERSEALRASVDRAFSKAVAGQIAEVNAEIKAIAGDFDRVTRQASEFAAAMGALKGSFANGGIVDLEIEKLNALMAAHSKAEEDVIAATYDLKIATAKAAAAREQANGKVEAAHAALVANEEKIALCDKELAVVTEKIAHLREARSQFESSSNAQAQKLDAAIAQLVAKEEAIREQQATLMGQTNTLRVKEQTAIVEAETAEKQMALTVAKAQIKVIDVEHASDQLAEKEAKLALETERKAAALKEEEEVRKEAAEAQKAVNDAAKDVAAAERAYAQALAEYEKNFGDNKIGEDIFDRERGKGLAVPVKISGTVKAEVVSHDLEKAINEGLIRSVKDMDRFNRDRARQLDKEEREKWHQLKQEKQKYDRLMERNRKTWSQQDKEFVKKFEKLRDTAVAHKKAIEDAKKELEEAKKREKDNHDNLRDIKKKMEKLGLK